MTDRRELTEDLATALRVKAEGYTPAPGRFDPSRTVLDDDAQAVRVRRRWPGRSALVVVATAAAIAAGLWVERAPSTAKTSLNTGSHLDPGRPTEHDRAQSYRRPGTRRSSRSGSARTWLGA